MGFNDWKISDEIESPVLHRPFVADARGPSLGLGHFIHRHLPGALGYFRVSGGEIRSGDLQIEDGLPVRFIFGMEQGDRLRFVLRAETDLFSSGGVLGIENPGAAE